jgi:hypothetical protein
MGTVEFTGFEMTHTNAFGQFSAMAVARSLTMPALICCYIHRISSGNSCFGAGRARVEKAGKVGKKLVP